MCVFPKVARLNCKIRFLSVKKNKNMHTKLVCKDINENVKSNYMYFILFNIFKYLSYFILQLIDEAYEAAWFSLYLTAN